MVTVVAELGTPLKPWLLSRVVISSETIVLNGRPTFAATRAKYALKVSWLIYVVGCDTALCYMKQA